MVVFTMAGWALILGSIASMLVAYDADQQMQQHRLQDVSPAAYLFIPVRWQKKLYSLDGHPFVDRAWRGYGICLALGLGGALLLLIRG